MTMCISVTSISKNTAVAKYDVVPADEDSNITVDKTHCQWINNTSGNTAILYDEESLYNLKYITEPFGIEIENRNHTLLFVIQCSLYISISHQPK